ncbi:MAG: hypothetical protein PHW14_00415 [Candidatus Omnitrophica bacterium]|nr:hypothetical protein [Candidatus Omnitrophota bacterium]
MEGGGVRVASPWRPAGISCVLTERSGVAEGFSEALNIKVKKTTRAAARREKDAKARGIPLFFKAVTFGVNT